MKTYYSLSVLRSYTVVGNGKRPCREHSQSLQQQTLKPKKTTFPEIRLHPQKSFKKIQILRTMISSSFHSVQDHRTPASPQFLTRLLSSCLQHFCKIFRTSVSVFERVFYPQVLHKKLKRESTLYEELRCYNYVFLLATDEVHLKDQDA